MKKQRLRGGVFLLCLLILVSSARPAGAWMENFEMQWGCPFTYKVRSGESDQIRSDWQNAALDWTNAHTDIQIVSSSASENELYSQSVPTTADRGRYIARNYGTGTNRDKFENFDAWINRYYPQQTYAWRSTACHELGHVLGLGHAATETCIMNGNRDRNTVYTPQTDDINGVIRIRGL